MSKIFSLDEIKRIFKRGQPKSTLPGLCSISFSTEGLALAYVLPSVKGPVLQHCQFVACAITEQLSVLTSLVAEHNLQGVACSWLLQPADYKILSVAALPVEPSEMAAALSWNIKDLIDFPVADAAIDYFAAPAATTIGNKPNNLNVVVTHRNQLQKIAEVVQASGLILTTIDIPELALRNCAMLFDKEEKGLTLIWTNGSDNLLVIVRQGCLYHSRNIIQPNLTLLAAEITATLNESQEKLLERFILDVQRSMDYYQSQLHQPALTKMLITLKQPQLLEYLTANLVGKVEELDLRSVLTTQLELNEELQTHCLAVIGGALREI